jgi:hypothetical protein
MKTSFLGGTKAFHPRDKNGTKGIFGYIYPVFCLNTQPSCVKAITGETIACKGGSSIQKVRLPG